MRDVSRVEYDAALTRVRARANVRGLRLHDVTVADFTLAALGLDEPPTEPKPFDVRDHPMAFPSHQPSFGGVDEPVVPPSETPKACPTCKGDGAFFDCDACLGSGIDGGTP